MVEAARMDLLAIVDFIADDDPDAAQRLKDDIEAKTENLREFPGLFRNGRVHGTREMVAHANYIVVYAEHVPACVSCACCMPPSNGRLPIGRQNDGACQEFAGDASPHTSWRYPVTQPPR